MATQSKATILNSGKESQDTWNEVKRLTEINEELHAENMSLTLKEK